MRDLLLKAFPKLNKTDIVSTPMGDVGEDLQLSDTARRLLPYQCEIKFKAKSQIHTYYDQAKEHGEYEPLVIVKMNRHIPLAVISLDHFIELLKGKQE